MSRAKIALLTSLVVLSAALALSSLTAAAGEGKIIVPGRTVSTQEDFFVALGGEKTSRINSDGSIFLFETIYLETPIVLSEGDFRLDGNADIVPGDFPAFVLENGATLSVGKTEQPEKQDERDVSIAFDGEGKTFSTPLIRVGEGCTLSTHYLFRIKNRVSTCDGCAIENAGTFVMYEGEISSCRSLGAGGAVYNTGTAVLRGGTITGCSAENGGAVSGSGELNLAGTQIQNCMATLGGAIFGTGKTVLTASSVIECGAVNGGAFCGTGEFVFSGGVVEKCSADERGGGLFIAKGGSADISSALFDGCTAAISGGSVHNEGELKLSGGMLSEGEADRGGNVFNVSGARTVVTGGQCVRGKAALGGGIFNEGYLSLTVSGVSSNRADHGTAVFNFGEFHISGFPYLDKKHDFFLVMNDGDPHPLFVDSEMKADVIARLTPGTFDGQSAVPVFDEGVKVLEGDFVSQASGHYTLTQPEDGRQLVISEGVVTRVRSVFEGPVIYVAAAAVYVALIAGIVAAARLADKKKNRDKKPS